ncbi:MAG: IgGFc-binding protein, partial [Candidatus Kapabacteria bacterium]|nr:IgGFc-binding protein [Candidatus Kapabacteria bacterium]
LLDQGDVLVIANKIDGAGSDLSGSVITSTFPVAVVSGNQGANVPASTTGFNYIAEMEIPTDAWGTQYLIPPNETRLQSMMMKVFAAQPDTKLMRNSDLLWRHIETSGGTEGTGYIHERVNDGSNTAVTLTGDKPIGVTVYNPGYGEDSADAKPFQMGIIPVEHFGTYYQYSLPSVQMNTVQHNAILVYPLTSAYGIPDDLEVATEQNGIRVWQRVSAVFGSFTGSMFPTVVNNRRYAAKYIRLPLQRVYAFRAAIPFTVYMTGMISDGFSGGTTTYGSYCGMNYNSRSSQFADTIPPMPVVLSVTPSVVRGTVRDLPDDSTVRSNLLSISLHGQLSNNTTLAPGSVTGRASASWRVERIDRNADADACIIFKDVAGNDTILYVTFRGTKVGITGLKDNPPEKPKISASRNQQTFCRDSNIVLTLSATPGHTTYLWSNGDTTQTITVNTDTAGTLRYSVTVKNFFGDTAKSDVIFFQVLPVPRKPVIRFDGNETLSFDEENGVQYQWYFNERVLLGRTRSPMIIREKISGKYTVLATIAPCSTLSDEYFVSINSVEDDEPKQMSIRPNPASNEVRIRFESQSAG